MKLQLFFLAWEEQKKLKVSKMQFSRGLTPGTQMLFRHNEGKWIHFSFSSLFCWKSLHRYMDCVFFCESEFRWNFFLLHFYGNVCNCIPKLIWPRKDWFWIFLLENASFCRRHIYTDQHLKKMLICVPLLTTWIVFGSQFGALPGLFSKCAPTF